MAPRSSALAKSSAQRQSAAKKPSAPKAKTVSKPGKLPEWNLADLYSGIGAPEVTRDLDRMDAE